MATLIAIAIVAMVVLFPIYWLVVGSLLSPTALLSSTPPLIPNPADLSLGAYAHVLESYPIARWFRNSLIVTSGTVGLSLIIAFLGGYSLSRFSGPATIGIGYFTMLTRMLPGTMLVIPVFVIYSELRLIDSLYSLIIANATVTAPFAIWLMKGFIDAVPREIDEAALVDGCGYMTALFRVILPAALPGIGAVAVYAALLSWSDLLFARTLITSPNEWTLPVGITSFIGATNVDWSGLMAGGVISVVPLIVLFSLVQPLLVSGLSSGATKG